jgi:RES domain
VSPALRHAELPDCVYRLGREPDPWEWPDWSYAIAGGTFGNRFDDPEGQYRVLYASAERETTFRECLARFRPDPAIVAAEIAENSRPLIPGGYLPHEGGSAENRKWRFAGKVCESRFRSVGFESR